ncbi:MAG TPA: YccF domain-containing protein [Streptosporangiaceae bacterium]|jgi:uncharacterized membrane protein YccF (DUF307 family)|nr:YccF domain-containing protein [Streptosporangiaceae bacterium]
MVKCQQGILGGRGANTIRALLNVIWLVFCGLWMALAYVAAAIICFVLIVTIPFGIASMRIAGYVLWPFGRTIEPRRDSGVGSLIGNILWVILFGWWLAIGHLVSGILLCLTIIGIPLGLASFKIIPITLMPLGMQIVPVENRGPGAATW